MEGINTNVVICIVIGVAIYFLVYVCDYKKESLTMKPKIRTIAEKIEDIPEETLVTLFYTPYCSDCKHFMKHWKKLYKTFEGNKKVVLVDVNCESNKKNM